MASFEQARHAKTRALLAFEGRPYVNGVGITRVGDGYAVKVNFVRRPHRALPREVDGVPIAYEVVGPLEKLERIDRLPRRPL